MSMVQHYVWSGEKKLRCGYTTGTCAAGAAKAALLMLLTGKAVEHVSIMTPKGIEVFLKIESVKWGNHYVECGVRKDAGDDPDVTHGLLILSKVEVAGSIPLAIDGGIGVGRVTKKGLEQPVGSSAINATPRKMIEQEVEIIRKEYAFDSPLQVTISVPEGEQVGKRTFNPRLGILGGISILGTSGIVVPMSEQALIDSIRVEMRQKVENRGTNLVIAPGNYGETFSNQQCNIPKESVLLCSNYIGETLDMAVQMDVKQILWIGHIGKFVKIAGGIMNTHSKNADCRAEILAANSAMVGADTDTVKKIAESITTDEALDILEECGLKNAVCERLLGRMKYYLENRCKEQIEIGIIIFSNQHGWLGQTGNVEKMMEWCRE